MLKISYAHKICFICAIVKLKFLTGLNKSQKLAAAWQLNFICPIFTNLFVWLLLSKKNCFIFHLLFNASVLVSRQGFAGVPECQSCSLASTDWFWLSSLAAQLGLVVWAGNPLPCCFGLDNVILLRTGPAARSLHLTQCKISLPSLLFFTICATLNVLQAIPTLSRCLNLQKPSQMLWALQTQRKMPVFRWLSKTGPLQQRCLKMGNTEI